MCDKDPMVGNLKHHKSVVVDNAKSFFLDKRLLRTRLWQLDHNYHCAVIGTCLRLSEVKKLLSSLQIECSKMNAYEIHITMVTMISHCDFRSKKVQSYLDKKFSIALKKVKKMDEQALKDEWRRVINTGDLVGTFWALMSHPLVDTQMKRDFYGDIHMLSHLSGASNRVDLKRLNRFEKEHASLSNDMRKEQIKNHQLKGDALHLKHKVDALQEAETVLFEKLRAVEKRNGVLQQSQQVKDQQLLTLQLEKLKSKLVAQDNGIKKQHGVMVLLKNAVADLKQQRQSDGKKIVLYEEEADYLQNLLSQEKQREDCAFKKQNLCGQCVLYVGGKKNLIPYYRDLIEEQAGTFIHHDGGEEKSTQDLSQSLARADIVMFPSDCISHDAYWKIKRICKKQQKPFKYLSSPGLCSLSNALNKMNDLAVSH